jgi:predicted ArsR family transcriptional regulator
MTDHGVLSQYGNTQQRLLGVLLRTVEGVTVENLVAALGISTNAVRQHLTALERDGAVVRTGTRPSGGRPEWLYVLSAHGREVFPRRYRQLAEDLIEDVGTVIGPQALEATMRRMGERAGAPLAAGGPASIAQTAEAMRVAGYDAAVSDGSASEIVAHNCVFHRLAERFPAVCQFDLAFIGAASGRTVEHRECMVRGGKVCRFGLSAPPKSDLKSKRKVR